MPQQAASPAKTALPRSFKRIRMELAREPAHPDGDRESGYVIVAPLTADGHMDAELWHAHRDACRVVRFRRGEDNELGHLVRRPGGSWAFRYDLRGQEPDEPGYRFQLERFVVGEYVSVQEDDEARTFRIVSVEHVEG